MKTVCLAAIMKRNGEKDETIESNYPNYGTSQRPSLVQRVLAYLNHDMVIIFLNDLLVFYYQFFMADKMFIICFDRCSFQ